jgi:hypothetical protein
MDKKEFLEVLKQNLNGEVNPEVIEQNIRYYDQYISSRPGEEDRVLSILGDPRLISKTIIEADKAAIQKGKHTGEQYYQDYNNNDDSRNYNNQRYDEEYSQRDNRRGKSFFYTNLSWYHKLLLGVIILFVLIVLIFVGRILLAFGLPILLIVLLISLFRRR